MSRSNRSGNSKAIDWAFPLTGIIIAIALAWGVGWLQAREEYNRQQTPKAYAEAAKKDAERACIGIDPRAVFECVSEKAETAYQTAHDEQDLSAQQRAASSALITAVLSFLALVLSGFGVWFVKKTLDATIAAVEDTGKATRAMERQNRLAEDGQRPWLSIELTFESADFSDDLFHIKGFVSIKNIGSMVARQFYPRLNCRFRGIDFSDDILALHREWTDRIPVVSDVLLPGEELRLSCNIVERPEYIRWYEDGDKRRAFAVVIACAQVASVKVV